MKRHACYYAFRYCYYGLSVRSAGDLRVDLRDGVLPI